MTGPVEVLAPNFKRRLSGVTATIVRLVPVQAAEIGIRATGPGLPPHVPHVPLWRLPLLPRRRRVWHARRNIEMIGGLILKHLFRMDLALVFTSASQRRHTRLTRWLIRRMDRVVATSGLSAGYLERPATVIRHGIDTESFRPAPDRAALRRELGLPEADLLVGCFGRIRAQKGSDLFVRAMIALLPAHPGARALLMGRATEGHGAFLEGLKAEVAAAGLSDRVIFAPEVPVHEVARWYAALDLYVAPQRHEGFGLTPLEAMACGVPVVATDAGAFSELVAEDVTGTVVPRDDPAALTAAIARALDPATRARWAAAARPHVLAQFRIEDEARALTALYRELLES